ncbi:MAG: relaxase/mobilization nuclease domain-containing protein [Hyphomicrobiaceae bacterium]
MQRGRLRAVDTMVPNIKGGSSFRGAGKYYLHDKAASKDIDSGLKPKSDDRVAFMDTRNCVNDDPHLAIDEMWATAEAQIELKRANGLSLAGRKCTEPVKTISLSWHPSETPTPEQMIEAADGFLAKMGWSEHQAVFVGHNDTAHSHIHIILNRVHPETGLVLDDYKDRKRSQEWALEYEKEHGRIFCEKRLEYDRPAAERSANDNLPHEVILFTRPLEQQFKRDEQKREDLDKLERDLLKQQQRAEREAWFEDGAKLFKETRNAVWREVKEEYREDWKQFYKDDAERTWQAKQSAKSAVDRALFCARSGQWGEATAAFSDRDAVFRIIHAEFKEGRRELRDEQMAETKDRQTAACDQLRLQREEGYKDLLAHQAAERLEMRELHTSGERASHLVAQTLDVRSANQNIDPSARSPVPANSNGERAQPAEPLVALDISIPPPDERDAALIRDTALTGAADLAGGMIGGVASYLADQLGEAFAPTPPEVREAQAKALDKAKDAAEQSKPANPYIRHIGEADQKARSEREDQERDRYWDDHRERRRER